MKHAAMLGGEANVTVALASDDSVTFDLLEAWAEGRGMHVVGREGEGPRHRGSNSASLLRWVCL